MPDSCKTQLMINTQDQSLHKELITLFKRLNKVSHANTADAIESILKSLKVKTVPHKLATKLKEVVDRDLNFGSIQYREKNDSLEITLHSSETPEAFLEMILLLLGQNPSVLNFKASSYSESSETHFELIDGELCVEYDDAM